MTTSTIITIAGPSAFIRNRLGSNGTDGGVGGRPAERVMVLLPGPSSPGPALLQQHSLGEVQPLLQLG